MTFSSRLALRRQYRGKKGEGLKAGFFKWGWERAYLLGDARIEVGCQGE